MDYLYYKEFLRLNLGVLIITAVCWIAPTDFLNNIIMAKELKKEAQSVNTKTFDEARAEFLGVIPAFYYL